MSRLRCAIRLGLPLLLIATFPAGVRTASAQVVRQVTDLETTATSIGTLNDAGTKAYSVTSTNQLGGNPSHRFQIFEFDTVTGGAVQKTAFVAGVEPLSVAIDIPVAVTVSGDDQWLAFISRANPTGANGDGSPELFVIKTDGTGLAQLTDDPGPGAGSVIRARMAGSGNRIVFVSNSQAYGENFLGLPQLYVIGRDGSNLTQLTRVRDGDFAGLSVNADGSRVVFSHSGDLGDFDMDGSTDNPDLLPEIFAVNGDGTGLRQLTSADGYDSMSCDISADGSTVVFESTGNLTTGNNQHQREIFVVDWDGTNMDRLTSTNAPSGQEGVSAAPTISNDGQTVVFHSNHKQGSFNSDGNFEIYSIESSGSNLTGLVDTVFSDGNFVPIVSGDGSRILFLSVHDHLGTNVDASLELFAMDDAGGGIVQLTDGISGQSGSPDITPDGTRIVFAANTDALGGDADRGGEIYVVQSDGSGLSQVTNLFTGGALEPSISDDGTKIAFVADGDPFGTNADGSFEVFSVDHDGSGLVQLTNGPGAGRSLFPHVTGNGSQIFLQSTDDPVGSNSDSSVEIFRMLPDGTGVIQLTSGASGTVSRRPRSDATGTWLVFESDADFDESSSNGFFDVWRVRSDGSGLQRLTANVSFDSSDPDISSDGSTIVFGSRADPLGSNPENNSEIFVYEPATATLRQLTRTSRGSSTAPRLTGNGEVVFFLTDAPVFEADPDRPTHIARVALQTGIVERVGGLDRGILSVVEPDDDGDTVVFAGLGDFSLENPDQLGELWVIDGSISANAITVNGAAPTTVSFPVRSGPLRYDVIRGDVSEIRRGRGETVLLGEVTCLENDSPDVDIAGSEDPVDPPPGGIFFYLYRGEDGADVDPGEYGRSFLGRVRLPARGDCPYPVQPVDCDATRPSPDRSPVLAPRSCGSAIVEPVHRFRGEMPGPRDVTTGDEKSISVRDRLPRRDEVPELSRRPARLLHRTERD